MRPSTGARGAASTLVLTHSEIGAILDLLGLQSGVDAATVAEGTQSLAERGLILTQEGETRPSQDLKTALGPVMLPEESLFVVRPGATDDESSGLYFARAGTAVSLKVADSEGVAFGAMPRKALPGVVAALLAKPAEAAVVETTEVRELVDSLRGVMEWDETLAPRVMGVALVRWTATKGLERSATVLLHDPGFTWIESGGKARVAYVETQEDLAELVADLIGFGAK